MKNYIRILTVVGDVEQIDKFLKIEPTNEKGRFRVVIKENELKEKYQRWKKEYDSKIRDIIINGNKVIEKRVDSMDDEILEKAYDVNNPKAYLKQRLTELLDQVIEKFDNLDEYRWAREIMELIYIKDKGWGYFYNPHAKIESISPLLLLRTTISPLIPTYTAPSDMIDWDAVEEVLKSEARIMFKYVKGGDVDTFVNTFGKFYTSAIILNKKWYEHKDDGSDINEWMEFVDSIKRIKSSDIAISTFIFERVRKGKKRKTQYDELIDIFTQETIDESS